VEQAALNRQNQSISSLVEQAALNRQNQTGCQVLKGRDLSPRPAGFILLAGSPRATRNATEPLLEKG